jgi:hypothetical protein
MAARPLVPSAFIAEGIAIESVPLHAMEAVESRETFACDRVLRQRRFVVGIVIGGVSGVVVWRVPVEISVVIRMCIGMCIGMRRFMPNVHAMRRHGMGVADMHAEVASAEMRATKMTAAEVTAEMCAAKVTAADMTSTGMTAARMAAAGQGDRRCEKAQGQRRGGPDESGRTIHCLMAHCALLAVARQLNEKPHRIG